MRALLFIVLVGALASGCLRTKFDICAQDPPDPNCAFLDASNDAGIDASALVDASADAPTSD